MGLPNIPDVEFATKLPEEKDKAIKSEKDSLYAYYVENIKFSRSVKIAFAGSDAHIDGTLGSDISIEKDGAYITVKSVASEPIEFVLCGKSEDGSISINAEGPVKLLLNSITLKSQRGDAILMGGKSHTYAVLADGSENTLSDCPNPEMPPFMMGGMPPMGPPPGNGRMPEFGEMPPFMNRNIEENPEDYHEQYGARMKKPKKKKKIKIDGTFVCTGPLTISGNGVLNITSNNKVGIKSKESLMFRPGNIVKVTAMAGKGVNAKNELYMHGGILNIDCSFSSDKALTCGRNMYFRGGHTVVKAGGGEASEGVESKFNMHIDGGTLEVAAQDDAINSQGDLIINGGKVRAFSLANDAVDSNCNIVINGGEVLACGTGMPEGGLDSNDEEGYRLFINGGTVAAVGGRHSSPEKQSRQPSIVWRVEGIDSGKAYCAGDAAEFKAGGAYQISGGAILFSSPKLKKGKTYPLTIDGEEKGKVDALALPYSSVNSSGMNFPF
jgi:hypothetical protein